MNIIFGFHALDPDPARSRALVDGVRIYPYAERDDPAPTRIISPDGRACTGDQPHGLAYWQRLHEIDQSEIVDERRPVLPTQASAAGELMAQANTFDKRFPHSRA
jgi:hypothetical protein